MLVLVWVVVIREPLVVWIWCTEKVWCVIENKEVSEVIWLQHAISKSQGKVHEVIERADEWILVHDKISIIIVSTSAVKVEEVVELGDGLVELMTAAVWQL